MKPISSTTYSENFIEKSFHLHTEKFFVVEGLKKWKKVLQLFLNGLSKNFVLSIFGDFETSRDKKDVETQDFLCTFLSFKSVKIVF